MSAMLAASKPLARNTARAPSTIWRRLALSSSAAGASISSAWLIVWSAPLKARISRPSTDNARAGHRHLSRSPASPRHHEVATAVPDLGGSRPLRPLDFGIMTEPFGQKTVDTVIGQSMLTEPFGQ